MEWIGIACLRLDAVELAGGSLFGVFLVALALLLGFCSL